LATSGTGHGLVRRAISCSASAPLVVHQNVAPARAWPGSTQRRHVGAHLALGLPLRGRVLGLVVGAERPNLELAVGAQLGALDDPHD
jgi:hypothetical protein